MILISFQQRYYRIALLLDIVGSADTIDYALRITHYELRIIHGSVSTIPALILLGLLPIIFLFALYIFL